MSSICTAALSLISLPRLRGTWQGKLLPVKDVRMKKGEAELHTERQRKGKLIESEI